MSQPVEMFVAYARKDAEMLEELRAHLKPLERNGKLSIWYDGKIEPGAVWEDEIKARLHRADIVLLLVSKNSLNSDYFYEKEVDDALARHRAGTAKVIPLILKPCAWDHTPLGELQAIPKNGKPVSTWPDRDEAFDDAVRALLGVANKLREGRPGTPTAQVPQPRKEESLSPTAARFQSYNDELAGEMIAISGGTFDMGCTPEQQDCADNEKPVTRMTVGDFYMGKYELTFDLYDYFCDATGREKPADEGWGRGSRPVIKVSWHDAVVFCNWLSNRRGLEKVYSIKDTTVTANWQAKGYRLPTESEWEYAARGGGKAVLFGNGKNTLDPREVNFNASAANKKPYSVAGEYRGKTVPVGSLNSPNALGLHDMSGNVWEWCWDWFDEYPGGQRTDFRGPYSGTRRVLRGGSWDLFPQYCRVAYRINFSPDYRSSSFGFRLARTP